MVSSCSFYCSTGYLSITVQPPAIKLCREDWYSDVHCILKLPLDCCMTLLQSRYPKSWNVIRYEFPYSLPAYLFVFATMESSRSWISRVAYLKTRRSSALHVVFNVLLGIFTLLSSRVESNYEEKFYIQMFSAYLSSLMIALWHCDRANVPIHETGYVMRFYGLYQHIYLFVPLRNPLAADWIGLRSWSACSLVVSSCSLYYYNGYLSFNVQPSAIKQCREMLYSDVRCILKLPLDRHITFRQGLCPNTYNLTPYEIYYSLPAYLSVCGTMESFRSWISRVVSNILLGIFPLLSSSGQSNSAENCYIQRFTVFFSSLLIPRWHPGKTNGPKHETRHLKRFFRLYQPI